MPNINDYRPLCPVIFFEQGEDDQRQIYTIHCQRLKIEVECYISTAIVSLRGKWTNLTNDELDCVFALPTSGTVMSVTLKVGDDRYFTTAVLSNDEAREVIQSKGKKSKKDKNVERETHITPENQNPYEQYVNDLFRLPFGGVKPGETITLKCQYLQTLDYNQKRGYTLNIPLYFPKGTIAENKLWKEVVTIKCKINALSHAQIKSKSHSITTTEGKRGSKIVEVKDVRQDKKKSKSKQDVDIGSDVDQDSRPLSQDDEEEEEEDVKVTGHDFELYYSVKESDIQTHCIRKTIDDESNICLFVTPPSKLDETFGRAFFFILDRSGSMVGEPFDEATRALRKALDKLRDQDEFGICAFDHRQRYFPSYDFDTIDYDKLLIKATKDNIQKAKTWLSHFRPERGGTVIDKPLKVALDCLESSKLLPFVFLITDGAVHNERDICKQIEDRKGLRSRVITLGIGSFCNWFFLKMLSQIGRGFSDVVIYREQIYKKIDQLIKMAATPVLTDIELGLPGVESPVMYPFPIPDLFTGAPIVVSAQHETLKKQPKNCIIRGKTPTDDKREFKARIVDRDLPVEKIFIKQQIDLLTAQAWYKQDNSIKDQIVKISRNNSMPSPYTQMLAYETTEQDLQKNGIDPHAELGRDDFEDDQLGYEEEKEEENNINNNNNNNINEDNEEKESNNSNNTNKKDKKKSKSKNEKQNTKSVKWAKLKNNKGTVTALAIGGTAAIVGVGLFAFGDVAATGDNIPGFGGLDLENLLGDGCCDCDGGCGDCADCGDCGDCDCDGGCDDCTIM